MSTIKCLFPGRMISLYVLVLVASSFVTLYVMMTSPTVLIRYTPRKRQGISAAISRQDLVVKCNCSRDTDNDHQDSDDDDDIDRDYGGGDFRGDGGCDGGGNNVSLMMQSQNSSSLNKTVSSSDPESHLLTPLDKKNISIIGRLWSFGNMDNQLLFVSEHLIKRNTSKDHSNIDTLRQELAAYRAELKSVSRIILHQENSVAVGSPKSSKSFTSTSRDLFELLPKHDPIGLPHGKSFSSCAVVGNSGSVLHSGCGRAIDEHDFVIRCNLAPLAPFKRDAGMKSDYITMNPSIIYKKYHILKSEKNIKQYNKDLSQYGGLLTIPCFGLKQSHVVKAIKSYNGTTPHLVCMSGKHFQAVTKFWQNVGAITKKPSTGFYLVTTAIQICDEIDIYGFWPFASRYGSSKTDVPYHYFDGLSSSKAHTSHQMDSEFSLLLQLHLLGIVNLNVGTCSSTD